jgi:putative ATP-dependent endonuclease of OLD family
LTSEEEIPINKRGSGVRRLVLLNFFRARAEQKAISDESPSVIYAIEEPETSQHPNNQIMLINAFQELAEYPERQVILTTHTPTLARLVPLECLRYISCDKNNCRVVHSGSDETYGKIAKSLGVLPDHDVKLFIGLEGRTDIIFFKNISRTLHLSGEDVLDLHDLEEKGHVIFFPLGGSNLTLWTSKLANLNRPEFYLFDRDEQPPRVSRYQSTVDEINQRENCFAVLTNKKETENYIHPLAIRSARQEVEINFGDFDDVPALVAQIVHINSESPNRWEDLHDDVKEKKISKAKNWLNSEASDFISPEMLTEIDPDGEVRSWMRKIKELIDAT